MHGMQPPDKDTERMAVCKNSRTSQTDTDTGRKGCRGKRHHTRYKNFSGKGFQAQSENCPDEETGKDIQKTGMISDMKLTAEEAGRIKREHWAVENSGAPYLRREYDFSGIAGFY